MTVVMITVIGKIIRHWVPKLLNTTYAWMSSAFSNYFATFLEISSLHKCMRFITKTDFKSYLKISFSKATLLLEGSDSKILAEGFLCLKDKCSIEILMNCLEIWAKITFQYFEVAWNFFFYVIAENFISQSYFSIHFSVVCQEIIYECHGYWFLECRYMHLRKE